MLQISSAQRRELRAKATRILARYAPDVVGQQWAELFASLKRGEVPASGLASVNTRPLMASGELAAAE